MLSAIKGNISKKNERKNLLIAEAFKKIQINYSNKAFSK
jgi:hypothetical protein